MLHRLSRWIARVGCGVSGAVLGLMIAGVGHAIASPGCTAINSGALTLNNSGQGQATNLAVGDVIWFSQIYTGDPNIISPHPILPVAEAGHDGNLGAIFQFSGIKQQWTHQFYTVGSGVGSVQDATTGTNSAITASCFPAGTTFTISASVSPPNAGTVTGAGTFQPGWHSVTATPPQGSPNLFLNWTENGSVVSTTPTYTFELVANHTLVANFTQQTLTISVSASPSAGGTVTGGGTFAAGSTQTVTATANGGYNFVNWTENGNVVSASTNYTFTLNANRSLVANFTQTLGPVVTAVAPNGGPPAGGTPVTVTGANFTGATQVKFGSVAAATFNVVNSTSITATSPPGTGAVDITVTTPNGTSATGAADRFTYGALFCATASSMWDADFVSGSIVNDLIGSRPGSIAGGVAVVAGSGVGWSEGRAFQFDGSTGYIDMGLGVGQFGTGPFSLEAWFRWNGGGSFVNNIIRNSDYPAGGNGAGYWIRINQSASTIEFFVGETVAGNPSGVVTKSIVANSWHHVVGTKDTSGTMTLYIDGQAVGTSSITPAFNVNTSDAHFTLGAWNDRFGVAELFAGLMDQISIYNRALTAAEVTKLFASGGIGKCNVASHDFNGDGKSDILLENTGGGIALWFMSANATIQSAIGVGPVNPSVWTTIGQRDINGDKNADIILRANDGSIGAWLMNSNGTIKSATGLGNPGTAWNIVGTGDFNNDGIGDILLYHTSGAAAIWYMNSSGGIASAVGIGTLPIQWTIVGTGDFDGDGVWDVLWYHTSGAVAVWLMNGNGTIKSAVGLGTLPVGTWSIAGTGDFDGDGISDVLLSASGNAVGIWFMNSSGQVSSAQGVGTMAAGWTITETGDFNGDGKSDILWYHSASGSIGAWLMNGASITSALGVGSLPPASWAIVSANSE